LCRYALAPPEDMVEEEFDLSDIMGEEVEGEAGMSRDELDKKIQAELEEEAAAAKAAAAAEAAAAAKKAKKAKKKKSKKKKSEL
jgi:protein disulfide-isomerase A6